MQHYTIIYGIPRGHADHVKQYATYRLEELRVEHVSVASSTTKEQLYEHVYSILVREWGVGILTNLKGYYFMENASPVQLVETLLGKSAGVRLISMTVAINHDGE